MSVNMHNISRYDRRKQLLWEAMDKDQLNLFWIIPILQCIQICWRNNIGCHPYFLRRILKGKKDTFCGWFIGIDKTHRWILTWVDWRTDAVVIRIAVKAAFNSHLKYLNENIMKTDFEGVLFVLVYMIWKHHNFFC